jgi:ribosomal protein L25 (general stress protein Ctc)
VGQVTEHLRQGCLLQRKGKKMLKITADVYSGRANPEWIISDEQEIRTILREIANNASVIAKSAPVQRWSRITGIFSRTPQR